MPLLFSYGTLQQEAVQITTFGRMLRGHPDVLGTLASGQQAWLYARADARA